MPTIGSTAEGRHEKRRMLWIKTAKRNGTIKSYGEVQDGTTALLNELKKVSGLSMDKLLFKLGRMGQKSGV